MRYLITGGAGFIGSNFAAKLLQDNHEVVILDDLSRNGAKNNLKRLLSAYSNLKFVRADISKFKNILAHEVANVDVVFHLAAQVGVTTSVVDPQRDFEINAIGTLNVLEAMRLADNPPILVYASTNKVYGSLENLSIYEGSFSYKFKQQIGVSEMQPLDFHSPYGCSKGVGDQYVIDYARIYGLKTVVFRQSCIYGPGQYGNEDQGWVAWFTIAAMLGLPIIFYGNGKQTRDILYIDDLYSAWNSAVEKIDQVAGMVFNVGGGLRNSISLRQFAEKLSYEFSISVKLSYDDWRPGDQRIFISDNSLAESKLAWTPKVDIQTGTTRLFNWIKKREVFFKHLYQNKCNLIEQRLSA